MLNRRVLSVRRRPREFAYVGLQAARLVWLVVLHVLHAV